MKKNINLKYIDITFLLLPWFLVFSKFFSEIAVILIGLHFLIKIYKNKNYTLVKNIYTYIFIAFYTYIVLNSVFLSNTYTDIFKAIAYIRFYFFSMGIYILLKRNNNIYKYFFYSISLLVIIIFLGSIYEIIFNKNIIEQSLIDKSRISSFFGDELIMGSFIMRLFPIYFGIYLLLFKGKNKTYYFLLLLYPLLIILSGERSALAFFLLIIFYLLFLLSFNKKNILFLFVISSICLFIVTITFQDNLRKRLIIDTYNELTTKQSLISKIDNKNLYLFSIYHTNYYLVSLNMLKDNVLFGQGFRSYRIKCSDKKFRIDTDSCSTHPHNTYAQLLAETGFVGFAFIFGFFLFFSMKSFYILFNKLKKNILFDNFNICIMCSFIISLWPLAPTGNFFGSWLSILYYLPIGFYLAYNK